MLRLRMLALLVVLMFTLILALPVFADVGPDSSSTSPDITTPTPASSRFFTVLPRTSKVLSQCQTYFNDTSDAEIRAKLSKGDVSGDFNDTDILGCAIKTGDIRLYMVPYFVRNVLEFIIQLSGIVAVGAVVLGGFWYLFAGISEDKEQGKKAILYGLIGMVLTLTAWAIVNIVISFLTS